MGGERVRPAGTVEAAALCQPRPGKQGQTGRRAADCHPTPVAGILAVSPDRNALRPPTTRMFTGLVESLGRVVDAIPEPPGLRLIVDAGPLAADAALGDSICPRLSFELGPETLSRTTLGRLVPGSPVNLERSLRLSDRLGGHLVTGHVDGMGQLVSRVQDGDWITCRFAAPPALVAQMASKGSVAVDGVSLTLVDVTPTDFSVALIPHTLACTTLGSLAVGDGVNLETDLVFKYVDRWLAARQPS